MSYESFANKTRSQKFILCHIESKKQYKVFDDTLDPVFSRSVDYFVSNVSENGTQLIEAFNNSLSSGQFFYDNINGILYLRTSDDSNPSTKNIFLTHKHFYSNIPINLPHDLDSGYDVYYDDLINNIGSLKLEIDFENTGIALETDSSINLQNNSGYFDPIFDTHIWENQKASFYSWGQELALNESKLIYSGTIKDKSFSSSEFKLNLRDQLSELKQVLELPKFSSIDGEIDSATNGKSKRLIFGKVDKIKTTGIDKTLNGFAVTGTVTGSADQNLLTGTLSGLVTQTFINGSGTLFLSQLSIGDKIKIKTGFSEYTYEVSSIPSNILVNITSALSASFSLAEGRNLEVSNNIIDGIGTDFINEFSPDDKIKVTVNLVDYEYTIAQVVSPIQILITDEIETTFSGYSVTNEPSIPYRKKNRKWSISGHKLHEFSCLIVTILSSVTFEVDFIGDIEQGDLIVIESQTYIVTEVSGLKISVNQGLPVTVTSGDSVVKIPVRSVRQGSSQLLADRDYSVTNTTEAIVEISDLAEFNIAKIKNLSISFAFVNGSSIINSLSTDVDMTTVISPRDWIKAKRIDAPEWYEVLSVSVTQIILRSNFLGLSGTNTAQLKNPEYIDDNSLITCDCLGLSYNSEWIRTPSDAVKYIVEQIGITNIDLQSFSDSKDKCGFELSLFYPMDGGNVPDTRSMITDINKSCFGSLYVNNSFELAYSIINSDKPEDIEVLKDDDILSFSVSTKNSIINRVELLYRQSTDTISGSTSNKSISIESDFVNQSSGIKNLLSVTAYLYRDSDAQTIAERWLFFRGLTQSVVKVNSKLNLSSKTLNDKMFLNLSRLFSRYGGGDRLKIGIINSITKDESSTIVQFNDLGNVFNRVPAMAPDSIIDYATSSKDNIAKWGFIVDTLTSTPNPLNDNELGNNLIG